MNRSRFLALFGLLPLVLFAGDSASYIVHWTSDEPCYECPTRYLLAGCANPDCNVPRKLVEHFEIAASKEAALKIANEIGEPKNLAVGWTGGSGLTTPPPVQRVTGTIVAIYEARPLQIKVTKQEISTPQPPAVVKKTTVSFDTR